MEVSEVGLQVFLSWGNGSLSPLIRGVAFGLVAAVQASSRSRNALLAKDHNSFVD
jgi:hypothetical protein